MKKTFNRLPQSLLNQTETLFKVASKSNDASSKIELIHIFRNYLNKTQNIPKSYSTKSVNNTIHYHSLSDDYILSKLKICDQSSEVIKPFLTVAPIPSTAVILKVLKDNTDIELNKIALNVLLYKHKDPKASLDLILMNSKVLNKLEKSNFKDKILSYVAILASINLGMEYTQILDISTYLLLDFGFINSLFIMRYMKSIINSHSSVISWRPGYSIYHRMFNNESFLLMSKAVTVITDIYVLNVANYNIKTSTLIKSFQKKEEDEIEVNDYLLRKLRSQGMMLRKSEQEEMFQEYWNNAGDGFEWVEPEKDPMEFLKL